MRKESIFSKNELDVIVLFCCFFCLTFKNFVALFRFLFLVLFILSCKRQKSMTLDEKGSGGDLGEVE